MKIRKAVHFEAVQVVSRLEDGRLKEWWPGDKVANEQQAKANAVANRKSSTVPGAEFTVIRVTIDEI